MSPLAFTAFEAQGGSGVGKGFSAPCASIAYFNLQLLVVVQLVIFLRVCLYSSLPQAKGTDTALVNDLIYSIQVGARPFSLLKNDGGLFLFSSGP